MTAKKQSRNEEMKRLQQEEFYTHADLAKLYGISRERVAQILGRGTSDFGKKRTALLLSKLPLEKMTTEEVNAAIPGHGNRVGRAMKNIHHKNNGRGDASEQSVLEKLLSLGIACKRMPFRHPYDIETESGLRIDVKHTDANWANRYPYLKYASPAWRFSHLKNGRDCNFFICVVPEPEPTYFVIPAKDAQLSCILIPYPVMGQKPSKWTKYLNRFDLLTEGV
jgi:hypothetical protein